MYDMRWTTFEAKNEKKGQTKHNKITALNKQATSNKLPEDGRKHK